MDVPAFSFEIVVILVLILAQGFFAAAEIAIVALRRSRTAQLIAEGRRGARTLDGLKEDPSRFLATVQIGITVIGSLASAFGGVASVAILEPVLSRIPIPALQPWAGAIAVGGTVVVISYLTLVLGELVPKSLALRHGERIACATAPFIHGLSRVTAPLVHLLSGSTNAVMRLFGGPGDSADALFSEEEVKHIMREGTHHGVFDEAERELIHSVFEFTDTSVREVMVPRSDVHAVEKSTPMPEILNRLLETGFSRAPVYEQDLDHIVGIVHIKDLLRSMQSDVPMTLDAVIHPAYFVPDSMQISDLLRELQTRRSHMALVTNEFGTVIGLVCIEDLLEEIVGEIRDEFDSDEELPIQAFPDGSLLVEGSVSLIDLKEKYALPLEETPDYRTIAGFLLARLKRIPKGGEVVRYEGLRMTIVTIDGRRLRKVRIERLPEHPPAAKR